MEGYNPVFFSGFVFSIPKKKQAAKATLYHWSSTNFEKGQWCKGFDCFGEHALKPQVLHGSGNLVSKLEFPSHALLDAFVLFYLLPSTTPKLWPQFPGQHGLLLCPHRPLNPGSTWRNWASGKLSSACMCHSLGTGLLNPSWITRVATEGRVKGGGRASERGTEEEWRREV